MAFNPELTAYNQTVCTRMYANARAALAAGNEQEAIVWQNGAAAHFVKVQHRMGTLQATMDSCVFQQRKRAFLAAQYAAKLQGINLVNDGSFGQF